MTRAEQPGQPETEAKPLDFIRQIIRDDLESGKHPSIVTRFPPEPNGYLHIGHAKSICLNFGVAQEFHGKCRLRLDDTNPGRESSEYVEAIKRDVEWLGFHWDGAVRFASDYFQAIYEYAVQLIGMGRAYVCDLSGEQIREYRGTLTEPGRNSPYRDRSVAENLSLFERMKQGEFPEGSCVLRAKIDMASPYIVLRDPVIYRILHKSHHRAGDAWLVVEDRVGPVDAVQREGGEHLLPGEILLTCARIPAQKGQEIAERPGQKAAFLIELHGHDFAVLALGDFLFLHVQGQGNMGKDRQRRAQGLVQQNLARGVGHMILAADDVGDAVADVVHHVAEQVERLTIGAHDDKILDVCVGALDAAQYLVVVKQVAAAFRHPEADDTGPAIGFQVGDLFGRQMTAMAVIAGVAFFGKRLLALGLQLLFRAEAFVGQAPLQQAPGSGHVFPGEVGLEIGSFVPVQIQPPQAADDAVDGSLGAAFFIGVFNAQHQLAAVLAGKEPVVEGGAGAADVQISGGTGGKANADFFGHDDSLALIVGASTSCPLYLFAGASSREGQSKRTIFCRCSMRPRQAGPSPPCGSSAAARAAGVRKSP